MRIWNCSARWNGGDSYKSGSKNRFNMNYSENNGHLRNWSSFRRITVPCRYARFPHGCPSTRCKGYTKRQARSVLNAVLPRQRKGIQPTGNRRRPSSGMKRCTNHGRKKSPVTMAPMTPLAIATNACIIPQGSTNAAVGT